MLRAAARLQRERVPGNAGTENEQKGGLARRESRRRNAQAGEALALPLHDALVVDARLLHAEAAGANGDVARRCVAIANHQRPTLRIAAVRQALNVLFHFKLQRGGEQALRAVTSQLIQRRDRSLCERGRLLYVLHRRILPGLGGPALVRC